MTTTRPGSIEAMKDQLRSCLADIEAIPAHLQGSEKHQDRIEERDWLMRSLARMEAAHSERIARAELN